MAFSYCPHCGFKNMYSLQAPKFCGGCGEGLNILSAAKHKSSVTKTTPTRKLRPRAVEIDDPDGSDVYEVPHISKLSYSIEQDKNSYNLKDLIPLDEFEDMDKEKPAPKKKQKTWATKKILNLPTRIKRKKLI